ncbi:MAG: bifunctional glycosyltransferase family 2/GtrA family protein [Clostridia bacterium]|nr:bifunctional glycosyltransferase family 2/GtrA family protein [Clostridia bacterium]
MEIKERLKDLAVIVPCLNPDEKLLQVVRGMLAAGFSHVLVVDDGSGRDYRPYFDEAEAIPECTVLGYTVNRGKGYALRHAFAYVRENWPWCSGVITVDADNQHTPKDTRNVALDMLEHPDTVVIGCRDFKKAGVPLHNRMGNLITSFVFKALCGIRLSDTQTGLRGIPAGCLEAFCSKVEGDRYEYETNMLLYMKTAGIPFIERAIDTVYIEGNKSSHFHVLRDSWKIYVPILKFSLGSGLSTLIDLTLFTILCRVFDKLPNAAEIFLATAGARICSSLFNYNYNRRHVFGADGRPHEKGSLYRYYAVAVCQMLLSWLCVTGLVTLFHAEGGVKTVLKLVVDLILFFLTFQVQREWVFKKKKGE